MHKRHETLAHFNLRVAVFSFPVSLGIGTDPERVTALADSSERTPGPLRDVTISHLAQQCIFVRSPRGSGRWWPRSAFLLSLAHVGTSFGRNLPACEFS